MAMRYLDWRRPLWPAFLVAASLFLTLGLACATPFAAFAAIAAISLPRRAALATVAAVWLANQIVGFTMLGYPWSVETLAWGLAIGAGALAAYEIAAFAANASMPAGWLGTNMAGFVSAFLAYEAVLYAASLVLGGSGTAFAPSVIWSILEADLLAWVILLAAHRLGLHAGIAGRGTYAAARGLPPSGGTEGRVSA
jgi:hypothetical protein